MTDTKADRLDEIREIWAKATPGPWARTICKVHERNGDMIASCCVQEDGIVPQTKLNAAAIAAAPDQISWLIAEVERLRKRCDELVEAWIEDTT